MATMVSLLGYTLDLATDGTQAVEMFKQGHYDLILMDCHMPAQTGTAGNLLKTNN